VSFSGACRQLTDDDDKHSHSAPSLSIIRKKKKKKMGIGKKRGKSGIATQYVTRMRAMKKLQINLQDFR